MWNLPFRQIWAVDFEYTAEPGGHPEPVCLVARELHSGRLVRRWRGELDQPPYPIADDVLFLTYYGSAEIGCHLALGWPVPTRVLDLFAEFRAETNGGYLPAGRGLLGALSFHGLGGITRQEKHDMRDLVLGGGPWSPDQRAAILDYCQSDVDALGPLLERMLPQLMADRLGLGRALLRGRYAAAVARMERTGVPLDVDYLHRLREHWSEIKLDLIRAVDDDFGVYEGSTFKTGLFAAWVADHGIAWPRTDTGMLRLDRDTFKDIARQHPELEPLRELRHALSELKLESLAVGPDGRNRTMLSPFGARTGRNTPSNSKFIFGPAVWLRGLIRPEPGRALAYIDYSAQEVAIAAALSGDPALLAAVESGDPYLMFAKLAGLAPSDATKQTHKAVRDMCKTCLLGSNYGMHFATLAYRTGLTVIEAADLQRRLARAFPVFTAWCQHVVDVGLLTGSLSTVFGWRLDTSRILGPNSLRNYPMQANGAEMLRLACSMATENGIEVNAPVHDALLVEGPADEMDEVGGVIDMTRQAMSGASQYVVGMSIKTDVEVIRWPDRFADPRGAVMWARIAELLDLADGRTAESCLSAGESA